MSARPNQLHASGQRCSQGAEDRCRQHFRTPSEVLGVIRCRLSARLRELGEDVDALLEEVMAEEDVDGSAASEQNLT